MKLLCPWTIDVSDTVTHGLRVPISYTVRSAVTRVSLKRIGYSTIYEWFTMLNDRRCACEVKSRIAMAKAAFNKKRALCTSTLELKLRKKIVKCYI